MLLTRKILLVFLSLLVFISFAQKQVGTLQIRFFVRGGIKKPVKNVNVKVLVNDSATRYLVTDKKGNTGYLELIQGTHKVTFVIEGFKPYTMKKVKVHKGSGRRISVHVKRASTKKSGTESK